MSRKCRVRDGGLLLTTGIKLVMLEIPPTEIIREWGLPITWSFGSQGSCLELKTAGDVLDTLWARDLCWRIVRTESSNVSLE